MILKALTRSQDKRPIGSWPAASFMWRRPMKRRELLAGLAAAVMVEGCTSQPPRSVQPSQTQESQARYTNQITLPKPSVAGTVSLEEAIEPRRSVRTYGPGLLPVGTIGQLLWAGQGVTSPDGKRGSVGRRFVPA
jgi:hypothetical protein